MVELTYLHMFLLKFRLGELVGCGIKVHIQQVSTRHTFDRTRYPKNKKYLKNMMMTSSLDLSPSYKPRALPLVCMGGTHSPFLY